MPAKSTPPIERVCEHCGSTFGVWPGDLARGRGRFCGKPCARRHHAEHHRSRRPVIPHPTDPTAMLVPLTRGMFATIDAEDAERVCAFNWCAQRSHARRDIWYAKRNERREGRQITILLHRFLMGVPDDVKVDHEDGDGLNCRRRNIRVATHAQNTQNAGRRSHSRNQFKGVRRVHHGAGWYARLTSNGKVYTSRSFATEEEAARAYDELAKQHHGKFARLNFPDERTSDAPDDQATE